MSPSPVDLLTASVAASVGLLTGLTVMQFRVRNAMSEAVHARWLATHDPLTGLPNRTAARDDYQRAARTGRPHALALLDLDDFKSINDTWGHHTGDALLVAVASRLGASCRSLEATAYRLGGDEFVLLLPSSDPESLMQQVTAIVMELGSPLPVMFDELKSIVSSPSASAGVAVASPEAAFADALRRADIALYHAKLHGPAPRLYSPDLRQPPSHRHMGGVVLARP